MGTATFAVDLVDVASAAGKAELRFGAEQKIGRKIALRGGYSTAGGWTAGIGLFGFSIAYSDRQPLEVVQTLRF